MAINTFNTSVQSLFNGLGSVLSTKSVVGEPITVGDTTIIPLVDVHFGMGAGSVAADSKNKSTSGGGMGVDIDPCAVLVIRGDVVRVIPVESSQSTFAKLIDMVPEIIEKFKKKNEEKEDPEVEKAVEEAMGK